MKRVFEKISGILSWIYGIGIALSLLISALSFLGYLVAIVVGGQTAATICRVIYVDVYPVLIYSTSIMVLLGLLKMYLSGEKALFSDKKK